MKPIADYKGTTFIWQVFVNQKNILHHMQILSSQTFPNEASTILFCFYPSFFFFQGKLREDEAVAVCLYSLIYYLH